MEIYCPNCKRTADLHTIDSVDFISCPECGWFQVQVDHTFVACDEPSGPGPPGQEPAALEIQPAEPATSSSGPASTSEGTPAHQAEPSDTPDLDEPEFDEDYIPAALDEDDLDDFEEDWGNVSVTFED